MFESKAGQRVGGMILFVIGAGVTVWTWHSALNGESFYPSIGALGTAFAAYALFMIVFPMDIELLRIEHGVPKPDKLKFRHFPLLWKIITVIALTAGMIDLIALEML